MGHQAKMWASLLLTRAAAWTVGRGGMMSRKVRRCATVFDVVELGDVILQEKGVAVVRSAVGDGVKAGSRVVSSPAGVDGTVVLYRSPLAVVALDADVEAERVLVDATLEDKARLRTRASDLMGRVVDWACEPLAEEKTASASDIFGEGLLSTEMRPIDEFLATGLACVDLATPLGRGQSVLVCGEEAAREACGRVALSALDAQRDVDRIYASLSPPRAELDASTRGAAVFSARPRASAFAQDCEAVLTAHAALAAGSELMRLGRDAIVVLDGLEPLLSFWKRSTSILADAYGTDNANLGDDSECRSFFSSLLQRGGRRKRGGSLAVVAVVAADPESDATTGKAYALSDFEAAGAKASVLARLELLAARGVDLTDDVLSKIGVRPPDAALGVSVRASPTQKRRSEAVEMLTSIADAHVDVRPSSATGVIDVDPSASLQRVGVGADTGADTRPPALRKLGVGNRLRLELAAAADAREANAVDARAANRARVWRDVLVHVHGETPPRSLSDLVALTLLVQSGSLDRADDPRERVDDVLGALKKDPDATTALAAVDATADLDDASLDAINRAIQHHASFLLLAPAAR